MTTSPKDSAASRDWAGTDISISDEMSTGPSPTDIAIADARLVRLGLEEVWNADYASVEGLASGSVDAQVLQRDTIDTLRLPLEVKTKILGMRFRLIPAGTFMMGSLNSEKQRSENEPQHLVMICTSFYMAKYQVTQKEWESVIQSNPSGFTKSHDDAPVDSVSWNNCREFLDRLCEKEEVKKCAYELPTEAEWEYACRAGTQTPFCYGNNLDSRMANFNGYFPYGDGIRDEYREVTTPVGMFMSNAWGLYDMHGNVWEWCQDWYGDYGGDTKDPKGPALGSSRVVRGGSCMVHAEECRSASRSHDAPDQCWYGSGLRLCIHLPS